MLKYVIQQYNTIRYINYKKGTPEAIWPNNCFIGKGQGSFFSAHQMADKDHMDITA